MKTPNQIVHEACGATQIDGCAEAIGTCYVCGGQVARGKPVKAWMADSYTDQNRIAAPTATHTCESCCFVMARLSPVPGRPPKEGKTAGGNFRNYSHLWEMGWTAPVCGDDGTRLPEYTNASKGQKPLIRAFLERRHTGPWFAAIADSGQKHVLPYTPINPPGPGGNVLFDEALVRIPADVSLIAEMCALLTDGATKEEIERGDYRPQTWQRLGASRIREFERTHGRSRGHWFALAIWLAQRDEDGVAARMAAEKQALEAKKLEEKNAKSASKPRAAKPHSNRKPSAKQAGPARDSAGGDDRGPAGRVPEVVQRAAPDVVLESNPDASAGRSTDKRDGGRVGHGGTKGIAHRGAVQLGLFGHQ
jgi:hypothetical protein